MVTNNNVVEAVIPSPEKAFFHLDYQLPPDQMQTKLNMVITIHHRHERSYGNAWLLDPNRKTMRLIKEIIFPESPKESHLFIVLGTLGASLESKGIRLGLVGDLYLTYFTSQIQNLLEKRAGKILNSPRLGSLQKARKIYTLIIKEEMEAKYFWVQQIHELAFEGGALSLYDAELCEAALYHAQTKSSLGRKYLD